MESVKALSPIRHLECCCCGTPHRGRQWWNHDTGYGLCPKCIDYCKRGMSDAEFDRCYGKIGVHILPELNQHLLNIIVREDREPEEGPLAGDLCIVNDPALWSWGMLKPGAIGCFGGMIGSRRVSLTFDFSAFKNDKVCSCSGGPGTASNVHPSIFRKVGRKVGHFWKWKNGFAGAGRGEYYTEEVDLWEMVEPMRDWID